MITTHTLVTSKLDFGNAALCGINGSLMHRLEMVQPAAARVVLGLRLRDQHSMTAARQRLHWLPIAFRIYTIICLKCVGVSRLQVAILARSPRAMYLTDRILPRYILPRVRVSGRPIIFFIREKTPNQTRPHVLSALRPDKQLHWKLRNRPSWVA